MCENRIKKKQNGLSACRHIRQIQITGFEGNFISVVNNGPGLEAVRKLKHIREGGHRYKNFRSTNNEHYFACQWRGMPLMHFRSVFATIHVHVSIRL
jgi:hypothetical protein